MKMTKKELEEKVVLQQMVLDENSKVLESLENQVTKLKGKDTEAKVAKTKLTKLENKFAHLETEVKMFINSLDIKDSILKAKESELTESLERETALALTVNQCNRVIEDYKFIEADLKAQHVALVKELDDMESELKNGPSLFKLWFKSICDSTFKKVVYPILLGLMTLLICFLASFGAGAMFSLFEYKTASIWVFKSLMIGGSIAIISLLAWLQDYHKMIFKSSEI